MTERETIRLHPPVILWWVWVVFVVANVADYAVQGLPSARFGSLLAAVLLLVTGVAYTLALRPKVVEDSGGLTYPTPGAALRVPGEERRPSARAPHLGEHTDEVLSEVLELSSGAIGRLHDAQIVAGADLRS